MLIPNRGEGAMSGAAAAGAISGTANAAAIEVAVNSDLIRHRVLIRAPPFARRTVNYQRRT